jgi:hypothetical protein
MTRRSTDGIGCALKPVRVVRRLLGRDDLYESMAEQVHPIRLGDMAVEGRRVELGEDVDSSDIRMQTVADGDINQPVLAADRHGGLGPKLRERKQARSPAAAEDESENFIVDKHVPLPWYTPDESDPSGGVGPQV